MTKSLRRVPRAHVAVMTDVGSRLEHAGAPAGEGLTLCGAKGDIYRHLFEDTSRAKRCPVCQARADAIGAADLIGAVQGSIDRGDFTLEPDVVAMLSTVEQALLATYPEDLSRPDFDVRYGSSPASPGGDA